MTVVAVTKDPRALTMTIIADFAASAERVWQSGPIHANWSAGGGHPHTRGPLPHTICVSAVGWSTT
jgi:hypothetical protein